MWNLQETGEHGPPDEAGYVRVEKSGVIDDVRRRSIDQALRLDVERRRRTDCCE